MDADELDWNRTLREQWEFHWNHQLRARLDGLTDDEYFWSPGPDAGSVRPRGSSTAPMRVGAGAFTIDYAFPAPVPEAFTTLAWRLGPVIVGVLDERYAAHRLRHTRPGSTPAARPPRSTSSRPSSTSGSPGCAASARPDSGSRSAR